MGGDGGEHEAAGARVQDGAAGGERVTGAAGGAGDDDGVGADDADEVAVDVDVEVGGLAKGAAAEHDVVERGQGFRGVLGRAGGGGLEHGALFDDEIAGEELGDVVLQGIWEGVR